MKQSAIGWTDYSGGDLNFVTGCTPISEGCRNCYARAVYERFDKDFSKVTVHPGKLARLARARIGVPVMDAAGNVMYLSHRRYGSRPMCFACDTGDLFHEAVADRFLDTVFNVLEERDDVIWQVLTKRAERMARYVSLRAHWDTGPLPPHVWAGVTVENQKAADERVPFLLDTLAAVRFLSCEPLLEDLDCTKLGMWLRQGIHWVIVGGESGPRRREFRTEWAHNIFDVCRAMDVPVFFKQGSGLKPGMHDTLPGVGKVKEWPV